MKMTCSSCEKKYPHTAEFFLPAKQCRGGVSRLCRVCVRRRRKAWSKKNRVKILARRRGLYLSSEKVAEARRKKARWKSDPIRQRAMTMQQSLVNRAKEQGLPLSQELRRSSWFADQLRALPSCPCCGKPFDLSGAIGRGNHGPSNRSPSVDRLVPSRGYVVGNIKIICWRCNNLKRDATVAELENVMLWMLREGLE
jgi:5-methylcytosine-specific restriction endonuclease McrA